MYRVLSEIITYKLVSAPSSGDGKSLARTINNGIERRMNMYCVLSEIITYKLVSTPSSGKSLVRTINNG